MNCRELLNRLFRKNKEEKPFYEELYIQEFINQKKEDYDECVICLEEMKIGETLSIINCFHIYHTNCIQMWSQKSRTCPLCDYKY